MKKRGRRRWAEIIGTGLFVVAAVNFTVFWITSLSLGGEALSGKIEDGRHFLKHKGRYTEVSEATWRCSRIHTISVLVTHPVGILLGGGLLAYSNRRSRRS